MTEMLEVLVVLFLEAIYLFLRGVAHIVDGVVVLLLEEWHFERQNAE